MDKERIEDIVLATAEGVTGAISNGKTEGILSFCRIAQAGIKGEALSQLKTEWEQLRESGKISDEYAHSAACRDSFSRVSRYFDCDFVDEKTIAMIRDIFIKAAQLGNSDSGLASHYIDIVSGLELGQIQILRTCYQRCLDESYKPEKTTDYGRWCTRIADASGLHHTGLVRSLAEPLFEKQLLNERVHSDKSGFNDQLNCGLTDLGFGLMEFASLLVEDEQLGSGV